jgi:hypothetical protein
MKKLYILIALGVTSAQAAEVHDSNAWEAMFRAAGGGGEYCAQTGECINPQKWDRATKEQCLDLWANPNNLSCNGPCTAADRRRRDVANGGVALADKCEAYRADTKKDFDTALTKEREWNNAHYVTTGDYCQRVRSLMATRITNDPVVVCDARDENLVGGVARGNYRGGGPNALWYFTGSWDGELMTTPCGDYEKNEASPCYRARQVVTSQ